MSTATPDTLRLDTSVPPAYKSAATLSSPVDGQASATGRFYDYVVIGSGAGGATTAHYLSRAGARVLLLESGKRYQAHEYPKHELGANAQLLWGGGTELTHDARTIILRGRVLGGGTVVNQALLDRFDDVAWRDFKAVSGVSFYDVDSMAAHYDAIEEQLALYTFNEDDWNGNAKKYVEAFDKLGYAWSPLRRGQSCCRKDHDCIQCLGGCVRDSKQSMGVTFLKTADLQRLHIVTQVHVQEIFHSRHFVTVAARQQGRAVRYYANKCILAAGAIGSTELLLKSQLPNPLPALGHNFFCHPQFMTIGLMDEVIDAHKGYLQAVKSSDPRFREWRFKFENVFAGPVAIALLKYDFGKRHQAFMQQYRNMACMEVALRDSHAGQLRLDKNNNLLIDKTLSDTDRANAQHGIDIVRELLSSVGAKELMTSPMQIGLHLMGGTAMGHELKQAVVGEDFKVYGCDNLYVVDGGLFANAPGINPSLTIMALGHRAAQSILAEAGRRAATERASESGVSGSRISGSRVSLRDSQQARKVDHDIEPI